MVKQILVVVAVIVLIVAMAPVALAEVPQLISFQGKLYDDAGDPLTGQLEITFRIYDAESNGTELWSETDSLTCENGLYSVILGLKTPLNLDFDGQYWLGVQITGDEELAPRYRLVSVPTAFRAQVANQVSWTNLTDVPAGFADGTDDVGAAGGVSQVNAGTGIEVTNPTGPTAIVTHAADASALPDAHHTKTTDASELTSGTLDNARLNMGHGNGIDADMVDGKHASELADSDHEHDDRYYTETELNTSDGDAPNEGSNRVSWANLTDVPAGLADGVDDVGAPGEGVSQIDAGPCMEVTNPTGPTATIAHAADASALPDAHHTKTTDASELTAGTLDNARFSAYNDLDAEAKIGTGSDQVAAGDHSHDEHYYTKESLNTSDGDAPNVGSNQVHWDNLNGVPEGFADGVDDVGGVTDHGALIGLEDDDHPQYALDTDLAVHTADSSAHHTKTTDASELTSGTLDNARFSAYSDLNAEGKIGTGADKVAAGDHNHDGDYAPLDHNHDGIYSPSGHNHDTDYVNEGQANSITSGMIVDGTVQQADLSFPIPDGHSLDAADGSPTDALYVDNDGNVGIGTTNPSADLNVVGVVFVNGTVNGMTSTEDGVSGLANSSGNGVHGQSVSGDGVHAYSSSGNGVYSQSVSGHGVYGRSDSRNGVRGYSGTEYGVYGISHGGVGGYFTSTSGYGLIVESGNVGIGTTGPGEKLEVAGNIKTSSESYVGPSNTTGMYFKSGNIGIGTTSPGYKLDVDGNIFVRGTEGFNDTGEDAIVHFGHPALNIRGEYGTGVLISAYNAADALTVREMSGNVGIGDTSPDYKLDVAGDINTTGEVRKSGTAYNNPDYVFEPTYELMSLKELRAFVTEKKHLPNMPSTEKVRKEGVKMFEQNRLMLEKLEEAYLYIFELEERIARLEVTKDKR